MDWFKINDCLQFKNLSLFSPGVSIVASKGYKIETVVYVKPNGDVSEQNPTKPKSSMKIKDAEQLKRPLDGNTEFFVELVGPRGEKIEATLYVSLKPTKDVYSTKNQQSLIAGFIHEKKPD